MGLQRKFLDRNKGENGTLCQYVYTLLDIKIKYTERLFYVEKSKVCTSDGSDISFINLREVIMWSEEKEKVDDDT